MPKEFPCYTGFELQILVVFQFNYDFFVAGLWNFDNVYGLLSIAMAFALFFRPPSRQFITLDPFFPFSLAIVLSLPPPLPPFAS